MLHKSDEIKEKKCFACKRSAREMQEKCKRNKQFYLQETSERIGGRSVSSSGPHGLPQCLKVGFYLLKTRKWQKDEISKKKKGK